MVPTLIEREKTLDNYGPKFSGLARELPKNTVVIFVDPKNNKETILLSKSAYEELESLAETADLILNNPNIIDELKEAEKNARKSKPITIDELRDKLGL